MRSVLYQMYTGMLDPATEYEPLLQEHKELLRNRQNCYDLIREELAKSNPFLKTALDKILDEEYMATYFQTAQMYMDGFRLGVKVMAEVYQPSYTAETYD